MYANHEPCVSLGGTHNPAMQTQMWHNMFALGLPIAEKILRPILVYAFLIVGLRLAGKRELAQLNPFDLVVLLTLSNTVQNAIIGEDNSVTGGVIGASTLLLVNYVLVRFVSRHETLERLVEGDPDVLIENGEITHDCLQKEAITVFELRGGGAQAGVCQPRRNRPRRARPERQHLLLRQEAESRHHAARRDHEAARSDDGAAGGAEGMTHVAHA